MYSFNGGLPDLTKWLVNLAQARIIVQFTSSATQYMTWIMNTSLEFVLLVKNIVKKHNFILYICRLVISELT